MGTVKESLARTEKGSEHWMAKLEEGGEVEVSAASNSRTAPTIGLGTHIAEPPLQALVFILFCLHTSPPHAIHIEGKYERFEFLSLDNSHSLGGKSTCVQTDSQGCLDGWGTRSVPLASRLQPSVLQPSLPICFLPHKSEPFLTRFLSFVRCELLRFN